MSGLWELLGLQRKASPRATGHCRGIFWKPPLAALPAQSQPGTSGLESLGAVCHYPADKSTDAAPYGEVSHRERGNGSK